MFEEIFKPLGSGIILPPVGGGDCSDKCECCCTEADPQKTDNNEDDSGEEKGQT